MIIYQGKPLAKNRRPPVIESGMKILAADLDLDLFWTHVSQSSSRVLFLDYDGTLAPFSPVRDRAYPYPGIADLINSILADGGCRVVLVTGRAIRDLIPLLGLKTIPEIWGSHGLERMTPGGGSISPPLEEHYKAGLQEAISQAEKKGVANRCEIKPGSVALHWRGLPASEQDRLRNLGTTAWSDLALQSGLKLVPFDGGLEIRIPDFHKGLVVDQVLSEIGSAAAAYLGDDLTDEDAFRALKGRGLSVLVREDFRPTEADLWIRPPDELSEFLRSWRQASTFPLSGENPPEREKR